MKIQKLLLSFLALVCLAQPLSAQRWLRQSTAVPQNSCVLVDSTDGDTAETGLTITQPDVRLSKNNGSFAQKNDATSATHKEGGTYSLPLNTTDTNTLGPLDVVVHEGGSLVCEMHFMVVPANTYDSLILGTDVLQIDVTQYGGTNGSFSGGRPDVNLTYINGVAVSTSTAQLGVNIVSGSAGAITSTVMATGSVGADELSSSGLYTIRKNVAGQKFAIFMLDNNYAPVTGLGTSIRCDLNKDLSGSFAETTDTSETELGKGLYWIDLSQAETNADYLNFVCTGSGAAPWIISLVTQH